MIKCPLLNPIRFYENTPDYSSVFPNIDNITQRVQYVDGIWPAQYYKEWLYGKDLVLQFAYEYGDNTSLSVYKYSQDTESYSLYGTSNGTDITPGGWVDGYFVKHTISLPEGTYYLKFSDNYTSDVFAVVNSLTQKKKLVEIVYSNSENDYGCIFSHSFRNYFCGQLIIGNPENEITGFESDRGDLLKLSAIPKRITTLNLNDVHYSYVDHINMIFACDTISVNGVTYQNSEPPTIEDIEFSDLKNITVKLVQTSNDYYYVR